MKKQIAMVTEMAAPVDEYENWLKSGVLIRIVNSATDAIVAAGSAGGTASVISGGSSSGGNTYDPADAVFEAWEQKNKSDEIINQKRQDATLGYERVYDTETGDIYRADAGFMESYDKMDGQRYAAATDDMYTEGYSGYVGFD